MWVSSYTDGAVLLHMYPVSNYVSKKYTDHHNTGIVAAFMGLTRRSHDCVVTFFSYHQ